MEVLKGLPGWAQALIFGVSMGALSFAVAVRSGDRGPFAGIDGSNYFKDGVSPRDVVGMVGHIATTAVIWLAFYGLLKIVRGRVEALEGRGAASWSRRRPLL